MLSSDYYWSSTLSMLSKVLIEELNYMEPLVPDNYDYIIPY
jgi:hypothetical protein